MKHKIILYGAGWCPDCKRSRDLLDSKQIDYKYIDIEKTKAASDRVIELNNGLKRIPTILFTDQTVLVEPTNKELLNKINGTN